MSELLTEIVILLVRAFFTVWAASLARMTLSFAETTLQWHGWL